MTFSQILKEKHNARLYYSGLMRTTTIVYTLKENGHFPWESEQWKSSAPELSAFLNSTDSVYGSTQEDYDLLLHQFSAMLKEYKWLIDGFHNSLEKEKNKYLPTPSFSFKKISIYIALITVGIFTGGVIF